jgi:hypothetical protein
MRELNWGFYGLLQVTGRTVSETKLDKLVNIEGNGSTLKILPKHTERQQRKRYTSVKNGRTNMELHLAAGTIR